MNILNDIFNFINNNIFFSIVALIFMVILSIYIIRKCFKLINAVINIITAKADEIKLRNEETKRSRTAPKGDLAYRLGVTNEMYNFITFLIASEIVRIFESYASLSVPYVVNKFDEDLEKVCSIVFSTLKPEIFENPDLLITKEALMKFIAKRTTVMLLQTMISHNLRVRSPGGLNNMTDDN